MEKINSTIDECIEAIINQTIHQQRLYNQVSFHYSMYPVPDGFANLPFFDVRWCLGSDRDHNLAS